MDIVKFTLLALTFLIFIMTLLEFIYRRIREHKAKIELNFIIEERIDEDKGGKIIEVTIKNISKPAVELLPPCHIQYSTRGKLKEEMSFIGKTPYDTEEEIEPLKPPLELLRALGSLADEHFKDYKGKLEKYRKGQGERAKEKKRPKVLHYLDHITFMFGNIPKDVSKDDIVAYIDDTYHNRYYSHVGIDKLKKIGKW